MTIKLIDLPNGWQRLEFQTEVEATPPWWQFWKPRILKQTFEFSIYLKPGPNGKEIVASGPSAEL